MDIPTKYEYDRFLRFTDGHKNLTHWRGVYSWVSTVNSTQRQDYRQMRGAKHASSKTCRHISSCDEQCAYRPAFDCETPDELPDDIKAGDIIIIGTLYMNDDIVRVPQEYNVADIPMYEKGAKLFLREPTDAPDVNVWGVYIGYGTFIADRPILKNISFTDIEKALKTRKEW